MFDLKRWLNAAPKLFLVKYSMKKEIAAVNSRCPDVKKIDNLSKLDDARGTATAFLKKVNEAQGALAKLKLKDKGAGDLLKLWIKTIKTYIAALDKRQQALIADVNKMRKDDAAKNQKIFDDIKADMERVVGLYTLARKHARLALKLKEKGADAKASNHLHKSLKVIQVQMVKIGKSAWKSFKNEGKDLTSAQKKKIGTWIKPGGGKFNDMALPVKIALDSVKNSGFPEVEKIFPPAPKL